MFHQPEVFPVQLSLPINLLPCPCTWYLFSVNSIVGGTAGCFVCFFPHDFFLLDLCWIWVLLSCHGKYFRSLKKHTHFQMKNWGYGKLGQLLLPRTLRWRAPVLLVVPTWADQPVCSDPRSQGASFPCLHEILFRALVSVLSMKRCPAWVSLSP